MSVNVGAAYMTILPDLKDFGPQVRAQVAGQLGPSSAASREVGEHGAAAGRKYGEGFSKSLKGIAEGLGALFVFEKGKDFLKESIADATEATQVNRLTAAAIRSTGGAAHISAEQVGELAERLQEKAGVDAEVVKSSENLLLTFRNVRNEAGAGNKIFDQGEKASINLAAGLAAVNHTALNVRASTTLVGKALNDPVKGLTALRRVGVDYTANQIAQVKNLVATNHEMAAQKIILRELNREFGGAAASQATPAERARLAWKSLRIEVGTDLLPIIAKVDTYVADQLVPNVAKFVHGMEDGTGAGGRFAAQLNIIYNDAKGVAKAFDSLPGPVKKYGLELLAAYYITSKLSTGFASAEARSIALRGAVTNLAGAGGLLLLTQGLKQTNTQLGALETVGGGALSGAELGSFAGPEGTAVGAAIGGLAGGLLELAKSTDESTTEAKVAIGPWKDYESTLKGVRETTTKATNALIYQRLQSSGLLGTLGGLDVSARTAVGAIRGNTADRIKLGRALANQTSLTENQKKAWEDETGAIRAARIDALKQAIATETNTKKLQAERTELKQLTRGKWGVSVSLPGMPEYIAQSKTLLNLLKNITGLSNNLPSVHAPGDLGSLVHLPSGSPTKPKGGSPRLAVPAPKPSAHTSSLSGRATLSVRDMDFDSYIDARIDDRMSQAGVA
ncbi:MAG TPA: hypothetical protein VFE15_15575 [Marmoricola sp.]|jgi:hypothetical protein|nr:hypothetical protein [Marmoricola sp.]